MIAHGYRVVLARLTMCGESGFAYHVFFGGREVFGGWSKGKRSDAMAEVREGISAREALRRIAVERAA